MTTHAAKMVSPQADSAKPAGVLRYVARQPILDRMGRVHGYELLFRNGPGNFSSAKPFSRDESDLASCTMLDNTVIYGLPQLTGSLPAFVKCTNKTLNERLVDVLPPSMTVLELVESSQPDAQLISTCQLLKTEGFRLALGSYAWELGYEPLVELADYIKVDFTLLCASARRYLQARASRVASALVAERVESQEDYRQACAEGFSLFQGYYFCRPTMLKNHRVPANRLSHIHTLQLLHNDPLDMRELSKTVKRDLSLTYRLLRLVNSPVCAMRQEVRSIESALMVVGEETFRRMASLAIASELNSDQPQEILRMAFVRGRFCELGAEQAGLFATEQYLLGMLSLLAAMLCVPIADILPMLPLRQPIREALLGAANRERVLLDWIEAYERGDWESCDRLAAASGMERDQLADHFTAAVEWTETALHSVI